MINNKKIVNYIEFLRKTYGLEIAIKDYKGFVYEDEKLEYSLRPYLAHTTPYCMFVKEREETFTKCIKRNEELVQQCREKDYFFNICHAGICELVIPIKDETKVYGSINISHYNLYPEKSIKAINKTFKSEERHKEATRIFNTFVRTAYVDSSTLIPSLELLAGYILLIIKRNSNKSTNKRNINKENQLEESLREYIKANISNKIKAEDIIRDLNITRSQLTTIIKTKDLKNLRELVNTIRIEVSEKLLLETSNTPKEIAASLGFKSYRHFETIFKEHLNISPKDYRKYYKDEVHY